jgi:hypothetical protein
MAELSFRSRAIVLALVISVSATTHAVSSQPAAGAVDVCALLPAAEVTKILGRKVFRGRPATRADGGTECRYTLGLEGTITVMVGAGTPKAKWDAFMNELKAAGATLEPAAGVGDGGYFWDTRLYTHVGNYQITVDNTPMPGASEQQARTDALGLAKALIAKLKA